MIRVMFPVPVDPEDRQRTRPSADESRHHITMINAISLFFRLDLDLIDS